VTQRIILAGGGHAHLAVLADWARTPWPDTERWLVTSARHTTYSGMLPGWMAGIYRAEDLLIDLAPLAEQAGAKLVLDDVVGLDPDGKRLQLASGTEIAFDRLSLATGGEDDLARLSDLGSRLIAVRPVSLFMQRWTAFIEATAPATSLALAVVGGGAAGVELALGAAAALRTRTIAGKITLVSPRDGLLAGHGQGVRRRALAELARHGIAVHFATATGTADGLALSDGTFLPADCVIAATGTRAPSWLGQSGLACTAAGFVAVGADLRSTSHPAILAAGDIVERVDRQLPRSGVHAVKAGPVLAANLRAPPDGAQLREYQPAARTLYLLATGDRRAIVSWGPLAFSGKLAWWLKDRIDRNFVARQRRAAQQ
jgi:pyridine nucleotide-disulfide oxidoreductase family protein